MIILGINGWMERGHDAAACLIIDGRLVAMAEEERFIRKKHSFDRIPCSAVSYCLYEAEISPDNIDVIAWGWDLPLLHKIHGRRFSYDTLALNELVFPQRYYPKKTKIIPVEFVNHHLAHAASVYCCRENNELVAIIVMDGGGEDCSVSIFKGENGRIERAITYPVQVSPGYFYEAGCRYLGFSLTQAGKLMGLAGHGESQGRQGFFRRTKDGMIYTPFVSRALKSNGILDWEDEIVKKWIRIFEKNWGATNYPQYSFSPLKGRQISILNVGKRKKDIAATIQEELELSYAWYVNQATKATGSKSIALAGGVSLNCSANGMILDSCLAEKVYLQPAAHDAGVALGAAVMMLDRIPENLFKHPYLGPAFNRKELLVLLKSLKIDFSEPDDISTCVAKKIAEQKVVGWFNGRMEVGPRALGARSILADPRNEKMHEIVNDIKSREHWRPLAPSIIEKYSGGFFTNKDKSPFMLVRSYVKPERISEIPAVVHVDGSVRPQTVSRSFNKQYYKLLNDFHKLTGIPLILNTSFNSDHEPIVCTPADAIRTFYETGIDVLTLGPFLIEKK